MKSKIFLLALFAQLFSITASAMLRLMESITNSLVQQKVLFKEKRVNEPEETLYWQDVVRQQPEGYFDDGNGNIIVTTAEGLAWWAANVSVYSQFNLIIDSDIDLSGRLWRPVDLNGASSYKNINGRGHVISNMRIIENNYDIEHDNCAGFLSAFYGDTIQDIVFKDPIIKSNACKTGTLAGKMHASRIINCGVVDGVILTNSNSTGGLIGEMDGLNNKNGGNQELFNSFANCQITSTGDRTYQIGGIVGLSRSAIIRNCYSSGHLINADYDYGGISAMNYEVTIANCYYTNQSYNEYFDGTSLVENYSHIQEDNNLLDTPVKIYDVICGDLSTALNRYVECENTGLRTWISDTSINGGCPVFGTLQKIICPNVANLHAENKIINGINTLDLSWDANGSVSSWIVRYYEKDSVLNSVNSISVNVNRIAIQGLSLGVTYKINVKPVCNDSISGGWGEGIEFLYELPYWSDVITSVPNGYSEDEHGNVYIHTAEGFAWLASRVNGLNGQKPCNYEGKKIMILSDIDLGGYRWMPIGLDREFPFCGNVNGCGKTIRNAHINENRDFVGIFGFVYLGKLSNITLQDIYVRGKNEVGGLCGSYASGYGWFNGFLYDDIIIDNCHMLNGYIHGTYYSGGILGRTQDLAGIKIRNCSASGNIYGWEGTGGIIGDWSTGRVWTLYDGIGQIHNCFSSANIYDYNDGQLYAGGIAAYSNGDVQNCYSFGNMNTQRSMTGQVLGGLGDGSASYLYRPDDSLSQNIVGSVCEGSTENNVSSFRKTQDIYVLNQNVIINNNEYTDLLSALNAWVDANNSEGQYRHWEADTDNINGGYPVFAPNYTLVYKIDGTIYYVSMLEPGTMLTLASEPTKEGYIFSGWSGLLEAMPANDVEITGGFYLYGDVNTDEEVDVVDVIDIARFVVATPSALFREKLADLNSDEIVNLGDAVMLINHIAGDQNFVKPMFAPSICADNDATLRLTKNGKAISLDMTNTRDYTAFQFDLYVSEDADVTQMQLNVQRKQTHSMLYNKVGNGRYRVAVLSPSNITLNDNEGEILSFIIDGETSANTSIQNLQFFDTKGNAYLFDAIGIDTETSLDSVVTINNNETGAVYDLQGRKLSKVQHGVNIVGGKALIVK